MDWLWSALVQAAGLIVSLDREVLSAAWLSLWVSAAAMALAVGVGLPVGLALGAATFRGKNAARAVLNALMALPTVLIGLVLYALLSRRGPAGTLGLLFTPWAMVLGQFVLATPIVVALSLAAAESADPRLLKTALTLGAGRARRLLTLASEIRYPLLAAAVAAFGRVIGEVGISMMLGGNIQHYTRNLTTAIALETSKGEFALGIALGLVLMALALGINVAVQLLRQRGEQWRLSWKSAA